MTNKTTCVLGFTLGAAAGAAMGLMFAPRPGTETRRRMREVAQSTRGKLVTVKEYGTTAAGKVKGAGHWISLRASAVAEKAHSLASRSERVAEPAAAGGSNGDSAEIID